MRWRGRLGFLAACLLVFGLIAALVTWGTPSPWPSDGSSPTVTLAPGTARPTGLRVVDLNSVEQLRARFNADKGVPRLVLALAPT